MKTLKPADNYILLKPLKEDSEQRNGLIIVKLGDNNLKTGTIKQIGKVTDNEIVHKRSPNFNFEVGDNAYYLKTDGIEIEYNQEKFVLIHHKGIVAIEREE